MLDLTIITVNHYHFSQIQGAITSLYNLPDRAAFQLIAVDNTPQDKFSAWVSTAHPNVKLIQNKRTQGFAENVNQAIHAAPSSRYILLMNPDIECKPGVLDELVAFMDCNSDVGIAGAKLFNPDGTIQPSARSFSTPLLLFIRGLRLDRILRHIGAVRRYLMADLDHEQVADVDWVTGAFMIVRHQAIEQIGAMDEGYFLYAEDQDWCCRMWRGGWRVCYVPQAQAIHAHIREGIKKPWSKAARYQLITAVRMFLKFGGRLSRTIPNQR